MEGPAQVVLDARAENAHSFVKVDCAPDGKDGDGLSGLRLANSLRRIADFLGGGVNGDDRQVKRLSPEHLDGGGGSRACQDLVSLIAQNVGRGSLADLISIDDEDPCGHRPSGSKRRHTLRTRALRREGGVYVSVGRASADDTVASSHLTTVQAPASMVPSVSHRMVPMDPYAPRNGAVR